MDPDAPFEINCRKCGGAGRIAGYLMDGGRCWRCDGSGREMTTARKVAQRKRDKERARSAAERKRERWFLDRARQRAGWSQEQYEADVRDTFTVEPSDGRISVWRDEPGGETDRVTVPEMAARRMAEDAVLRGDVPDPTPDEPDEVTEPVGEAELSAADLVAAGDVTNQRDAGYSGGVTDAETPRSPTAPTAPTVPPAGQPQLPAATYTRAARAVLDAAGITRLSARNLYTLEGGSTTTVIPSRDEFDRARAALEAAGYRVGDRPENGAVPRRLVIAPPGSDAVL